MMASMVTEPPIDWQENKSLVEACRHMNEQQIMCDVTFLVGESSEPMSAHKFILICRSSVFYSMFCGPLAERNTEICIPDIQPDAFRLLLRYMYTDETELTADNVLPLLYAAKKYNLKGLVRNSLAFLQEGRSVENICVIFEQAYIYDDEEFMKTSLEFINVNGRSVLQSAAFLELSPDCVKKIVSADELHTDERTVLESVVKWGEAQCKKKNIEPSPTSIRSAIGDILYLIRFPLLEESYFTNVVSDMSILSDSEMVELFKYFYKSGATVQKFVSRERNVSDSVAKHTFPKHNNQEERTIQTCIRFQNVCDDGSWYCGGEPDAIGFFTNQNISLHGVLVYGSYIGEGRYDITCTVYENEDTELLQIKTYIRTSEHQPTYPILFENSVKINQGRRYTILIRVVCPEGMDTYQGKNGTQSVGVGNVKFNFFKSKLSRNGTDTKMGNIPGILFTTE
ncbi:hypothetical protein ACJMK2_017214 [Sinanodonta woodiana]|uniref:BTB domain-containing protein n=1 Tax=Sinanodonta woodiana TaxID=1069815 RepID=A0ABD3UXI2_SINWO